LDLVADFAEPNILQKWEDIEYVSLVRFSKWEMAFEGEQYIPTRDDEEA
jgi:hypothetical protein